MRMHFTVVFVLMVAVIGGELRGADRRPLHTVIAPTSAVEPGTTIDVQLAVLNRSPHVLVSDLADGLAGEIVGPGGRWPVLLQVRREQTTPSRQEIAPGCFALLTCTMMVPRTIPSGAAILQVQNADGEMLRTGLEIGIGTNWGPARMAAVPPHPTTNLVRAQPAASVLQRTFADRLAPHEPLYFIAGADAPAAKFQFSFKYKVLDFKDVAPHRMDQTLQFAFTQRSLWDIDGESSPFYDTSYMPELIYEALAPEPEQSDRWFTWLGFQTAFKHESNGRDGPRSRSVNIVYAQTAFAFGQLDGWHLLVAPEVFGYVSSLEDNSDLRDYRGYGQLRLVLGRNDGPSLMVTAWAGEDFDHGSVQLDLTLPIRTKLLNFETYLLVQYFNGYGESLLSYREKSETVRAGVSLVR